MFDKLEKFHKSATGLLVFALVEFGLAFLFVLSALSTGSIIDWLLVIVLFIGVIQNFIKLISKLIHGNKSS